jgi:uncharacterized protein (TIGR02266 family)
MTGGRRSRAALGVTLMLCGGALLFLALRRQAEMAAAMAPLPPVASLAVRALTHRASRDIETWAEAAGAVLLLASAGFFLSARSRPGRRRDSRLEPSTIDPRRLEELEESLVRARTAEGNAKTRLAEAEGAAAKTQSLLLEQRTKTERDVETLSARIQTLQSELATERDRTAGVAWRFDNDPDEASPAKGNGGPSKSTPPKKIHLVDTPAHAPPALSADVASVAVPSEPAPSDPPRRSSYPELRRELRFAAHVEVDFESDSHFYTGLSENLSEGGLFVATYSPRPVGTEMDLTLKVPGQLEPMRTRGTVRWVREFSEDSDALPGMGLRLELEDKDLPRVRRFLSTRPPLFFDDD